MKHNGRVPYLEPRIWILDSGVSEVVPLHQHPHPLSQLHQEAERLDSRHLQPKHARVITILVSRSRVRYWLM